MTSNGFMADADGLTSLTTTLRNGAEDLASTAVPAPAAADAGRSSVNVGNAMSAIIRSAASLIALSQDSANKINTNSGAYGATDNRADSGLQSVVGDLTSPN